MTDARAEPRSPGRGYDGDRLHVAGCTGWRCRFVVVAPSTNTIVQPDMDDLRVPGVTNRYGRIHVPDMTVAGDDVVVALVEAIGRTLNEAVDRCLTCDPDYLITGMSALAVDLLG